MLQSRYELLQFNYQGYEIRLIRKVGSDASDVMSATWTSDFHDAAFIDTDTDPYVNADSKYIFILNMNGPNKTPSVSQLTTSPGQYSSLAWSPDGKSLAYMWNPNDTSGNNHFWIKQQDSVDNPNHPGPSQLPGSFSHPFAMAWQDSPHAGKDYMLISEAFDPDRTDGLLMYYDKVPIDFERVKLKDQVVDVDNFLVSPDGLMLVYKDFNLVIFQSLKGVITNFQVTPTAYLLSLTVDQDSPLMWMPHSDAVVYKVYGTYTFATRYGSKVAALCLGSQAVSPASTPVSSNQYSNG